jgi:hypothetical protein
MMWLEGIDSFMRMGASYGDQCILDVVNRVIR